MVLNMKRITLNIFALSIFWWNIFLKQIIVYIKSIVLLLKRIWDLDSWQKASICITFNVFYHLHAFPENQTHDLDVACMLCCLNHRIATELCFWCRFLKNILFWWIFCPLKLMFQLCGQEAIHVSLNCGFPIITPTMFLDQLIASLVETTRSWNRCIEKGSPEAGLGTHCIRQLTQETPFIIGVWSDLWIHFTGSWMCYNYLYEWKFLISF